MLLQSFAKKRALNFAGVYILQKIMVVRGGEWLLGKKKEN